MHIGGSYFKHIREGWPCRLGQLEHNSVVSSALVVEESEDAVINFSRQVTTGLINDSILCVWAGSRPTCRSSTLVDPVSGKSLILCAYTEI